MRKSGQVLITEKEIMNREQLRIAQWLQTLHFRHRLFGGVSERDVWSKLSELNTMYQTALAAERMRYDALLDQNNKSTDRYCIDTISDRGERR